MSLLSALLGRRTRLELRWLRRAGWMADHVRADPPPAPFKATIEALAKQADALGLQRLAPEYGEHDGRRTPKDVRSPAASGDLYAWLVIQRRPSIVVEIGSAFGVSGMYFAAGLQQLGHGHLHSFEINEEWATIAERNIRTISDRVTLTRGSFEDHVDRVVTGPINLALVDGIHNHAVVMRQFGLLRERAAPAALLLFDDIDFQRTADARMREAWQEIAGHDSVIAAVEINGRLGMVELKG